MQTMSKIFVSLLFCLALILVGSCGSSQHPSALVGKWHVEGQAVAVFELSKGGSGIARNFPEDKGTKITWKVKKERLYISVLDEQIDLEYAYRVSGKTLILSGSDRNLTLKK